MENKHEFARQLIEYKKELQEQLEHIDDLLKSLDGIDIKTKINGSWQKKIMEVLKSACRPLTVTEIANEISKREGIKIYESFGPQTNYSLNSLKRKGHVKRYKMGKKPALWEANEQPHNGS